MYKTGGPPPVVVGEITVSKGGLVFGVHHPNKSIVPGGVFANNDIFRVWIKFITSFNEAFDRFIQAGVNAELRCIMSDL